MEKHKRDVVSAEMRKRLLANRDGKLAVSQWLDLATAPLVTLLVLAVPAAALFSVRLATLFVRGGWLFLLLAALVLMVIPVALRARHYARVPVQHMTLIAQQDRFVNWRFWNSYRFYTDGEEEISFQKRLAPPPWLDRGHRYTVYFLEEPHRRVLLSCAPEDHEDAALWQPTPRFNNRYARRQQNS